MKVQLGDPAAELPPLGISSSEGNVDGILFPSSGRDQRAGADSVAFRAFKTVTDLVLTLLAIPIVLGMCFVLLVVNPFLNPGPLFYRQERMGLNGKRFTMWKFRTMTECDGHVRAFDEPLEDDRITPLGRVLRIARLDELPNFFNVLAGEMSVVGPRPDAYDHATRYLKMFPAYRDRFRMRPGITGLAQVRAGYADDIAAVRRKARWDHLYVRKANAMLDLQIIWSTLRVMVSGAGAK